MTPETVVRGKFSEETRKALCSSIWWGLLLTCRLLFAHASLKSAADPELVNVIASNLRALLLLIDCDLVEQGKLKSLYTMNTVYYHPAIISEKNKYGFVFIRLEKGTHAILNALTQVSYAALQEDFQSLPERARSETAKAELTWVRRVFGHIVYLQVATKLTMWTKAARAYSKEPMLEDVHKIDEVEDESEQEAND